MSARPAHLPQMGSESFPEETAPQLPKGYVCAAVALLRDELTLPTFDLCRGQMRWIYLSAKVWTRSVTRCTFRN